MEGNILGRVRENLYHLINNPTVESWLQRIGLSLFDAVNVALCFGIMFAAGFLLKRYFQFILGCTVVIGVLAFFLQSNNIISIDWKAFHLFLGFDPITSDFKAFFEISIDWVKTNIVVAIAAIAGFLIGYKVG